MINNNVLVKCTNTDCMWCVNNTCCSRIISINHNQQCSTYYKSTNELAALKETLTAPTEAKFTDLNDLDTMYYPPLNKKEDA